MNIIKFPGLNLEFEFSKIAFSLLGIAVYKYALCIEIGIIVGFIICYFNRKRFEINFDFTLNTLIFAVFFGIIGARCYYVIFNISEYSKDFKQLLNFRTGGLAIYGGLIFGIFTILVICKIKKQEFLNFLDYIVPSVAIAQSIGRFGNFFNIEAYGKETTNIFRMGIITINGYIEVHPTFLYEATATFFIFLILLNLQKRRKFKGEVFLSYCVLYSFFRSFIEGLRIDSLMLFNWRISQVLSIIIFVLSLFLLICRKMSHEKSRRC